MTVQVTRYFEASPERVFDAWLDPQKTGQWLFATPSGQMVRVVRVEIDARAGGSFLFVDRRDGEDVEHAGEYIEIDRPRRLVFTFTRRLVFTFTVKKYSQESTRVSIDIVPQGTGCHLTLTHENVLPDYVSRTQAGWTGILDELAAAVG